MLTAWLLLGAAVALIAASGLFVAAEFSFVTVSRPAVERAAAEHVPGAAGVQTALRSLSTQLSGAQVGITITNLLIGWLAEPSIAQLVHGPLLSMDLPESAVPGVAITIALVLSTIATMIFGELVPQNLALAHPFGVARAVQRPARAFTTVSRPLVKVLNGTANWAVQRLGVEPQEELVSARTPEELVSVVRSSAESGTLPGATADLVEASLRFDDKQAKDVLTPRTRLFWVSRNDPIRKVIELAAEHGLSRFPVIGQDLDDIVGVIELGQAAGVPPNRRSRTLVGPLARDPLYVPHTQPLDEVLWTMRDANTELAIVLDEYGGTAGIVTFEDLVEELVGPVTDEHDPAAESVERDDDGWLVSGLLRPDELRRLTGIQLPVDPRRYETIAGVVLHQLGRLPHSGETLSVNGVTIRVTRMDGRRIDLVHLDAAAQEAERP
ncbi:hemolysin family protein [Flindersiella endophytica]